MTADRALVRGTESTVVVQIVRREDGVRVGSIQVEPDGSLRVVSGPEDLRDLVELRLAAGVVIPRSHFTANGDRYVQGYTLLPTDKGFEHSLSSQLKLLRYCTESMWSLLLDRGGRIFQEPGPDNAR